MPAIGFRGDPYRVLDVHADSSAETIKRRYRQLARELHPDRAADPTERSRRTREMARINAAYDLLRDDDRRDRYDALHGHDRGQRRADGERATGRARGRPFEPAVGAERHVGPPPPPRSRPVTARFDTSGIYHRRNATTTEPPPRFAGQRPASTRERYNNEPLRASHPSGPVKRHQGPSADIPTIAEARTTVLEFGKFRGHTLGEIEAREPTYIDWIAKTITRDRELVVRARVIQAELDEQGILRRTRPAKPGFGLRQADVETAEAEPAAP